MDGRKPSIIILQKINSHQMDNVFLPCFIMAHRHAELQFCLPFTLSIKQTHNSILKISTHPIQGEVVASFIKWYTHYSVVYTLPEYSSKHFSLLLSILLSCDWDVIVIQIEKRGFFFKNSKI